MIMKFFLEPALISCWRWVSHWLHLTPAQRRLWHPTPGLLPGKSHGRRSLVSCSPWGREELDTTEQLHFPFSFLGTGEGNGNPLQCSCLENPRDGGAWWAAVCGVTQSRTRLKRLSSNPSSAWQSKLTLKNPLDCLWNKIFYSQHIQPSPFVTSVGTAYCFSR